MPFDDTSPALDDLLLDIATTIELSERDYRVAERRYVNHGAKTYQPGAVKVYH